MKSCTPLWREAHFEVNMYKTHHSRTTFGSCDVEKVHTSTSQNVQNTSKHSSSGAFLEGEMSKKCKPLWCEAHFEVKSEKTRGVRGTFGRSDVVSRGRRRGLCTLSKVSKKVRFLQQFQLQPPLHYTTLHYTTLHYTTLRYTTLHYTTPCYNYNYNYNSLRYPNYITLRCTTIH